MTRVLGLASAPRVDTPEATEFLRVLAALRAVGAEVILVEAGSGVGTLSRGADLDADGARYLAALGEDGVRPSFGADLAALIASSDALVRLCDPARTGVPPLLALPARQAPRAADVTALLDAGHVVLE